MRESTTISTTYYISKKSIRCRQHCLLQYISVLSVVIICIFISSLSCDAFQMTTNSGGRASSSMQMSNSRGSIILMSMPTSRLANQNNRIHSSSATTNRSYTSHTGSCNQSNLFPQRSSSSRSSILQMSSDNQVDNNEETNCPVTKLWLSFRKLLAKFWVSLLERYRTYECLFVMCVEHKLISHNISFFAHVMIRHYF